MKPRFSPRTENRRLNPRHPASARRIRQFGEAEKPATVFAVTRVESSNRQRLGQLHARDRTKVTAITVELDDTMAEVLRRLAADQKRSETEIVREALSAYVQTSRPLPKGMGNYHSGQANGFEKARELLRQAVKEGLWP
jgi:hypothetical protein